MPSSDNHRHTLEKMPSHNHRIIIELWETGDSGHAPACGLTFRDALLDWLLSQK